jgi:glycerophosphoryl diester phosphodiesterase
MTRILFARNVKSAILVSLFFILPCCDWSVSNLTPGLSPKDNPQLVAHGGGIYKGSVISSSLQALDNAYKSGFKFIEVDMAWTTDKELILAHDWGGHMGRYFNSEPRKYSRAEFKKLKMSNGLQQMDFYDLVAWLKKNKGVYIVTDIKFLKNDAFKYIKEKSDGQMNRFVMQIKRFEQHAVAQKLGFKNIILTIFSLPATDDEIVKFTKDRELLAVTIPKETVETSDLSERLARQGHFVYAHTVNDVAQFERFKAKGVKGIYTDEIFPAKATSH